MTAIRTSLRSATQLGLFAGRPFTRGEYVCHYYKRNKEPVKGEYRQVLTEENVSEYICDYATFVLKEDCRATDGLFHISSSAIDEDIMHYTRASLFHENVQIHSDGHIYTKRAIKEGEEFYMNFGIPYWLHQIEETTREPMVRMFCVMKRNGLMVGRRNRFIFNGRYTSPANILSKLSVAKKGDLVQQNGLLNASPRDKLLKLMKKVK